MASVSLFVLGEIASHLIWGNKDCCPKIFSVILTKDFADFVDLIARKDETWNVQIQ